MGTVRSCLRICPVQTEYSPNLCVDETSLSCGELYTVVTNRAGRGGKGTFLPMVRGLRFYLRSVNVSCGRNFTVGSLRWRARKRYFEKSTWHCFDDGARSLIFFFLTDS